MKRLMTFLVTLSLSLQMFSCSSTTHIKSTDPQARIFVNGEYRGTGSVTHTDKRLVGSSNTVVLKKEGCQDQTNYFRRDEELDVGALIGGILVLVPFAWIMGYRAERTYEFNCQAAS